MSSARTATEAAPLLETDPESLIPPVDQYLNKKNGFQRYVLTPSYRYLNAVAPIVFFGTEVMTDQMKSVVAPYGFMLGSALANANMAFGDIARALFSQQEPLAYLRRYGNGNACLGFTKVGAKFVISIIPTIALGFGADYAMKTYGGDLAQSTNENLQNLNFVLTNPVTRDPIVGAISMGLFGAGKLLWEKTPCFKTPDNEQDDHQVLNWVQKTARHLIVRPGEAAMLFEVARQALLLAGQDTVLHDPRITCLVVAIDQLTQAWAYSAFVAHPIDHLVPEEKPVSSNDGYVALASTNDVVARQHAPAPKAQGQALLWYGFRSGFVLGVGGYLLNLGMSQAVQNEDKENLTTPERIAYNAALVLGSVIIERAFENAPAILAWTTSKLSSCCSSLFKRPSVNIQEDYVSTNANSLRS